MAIGQVNGGGGDGTKWKKNLQIEAKYLKWFRVRAKYYAKVGAGEEEGICACLVKSFP
jgi:hypothetical protein